MCCFTEEVLQGLIFLRLLTFLFLKYLHFSANRKENLILDTYVQIRKNSNIWSKPTAHNILHQR